MKILLRPFLTAFALVIMSTSFAQAGAELVMVDSRSCSYCAKFRREIAPTYESTKAGQVAPLRTVSPLKKWPEDLRGVKRTPFAPVFILVENGHEVGRIFGYASAEQFWLQLNSLIGRL